MYIELNDAIKIYARACRTWYGGRAHNVVLKRAQELQNAGDLQGSKVWKQLATELVNIDNTKVASQSE